MHKAFLSEGDLSLLKSMVTHFLREDNNHIVKNDWHGTCTKSSPETPGQFQSNFARVSLGVIIFGPTTTTTNWEYVFI